MIEIRVANGGPTIPADVVEAVFDEYFSWGGRDGRQKLSGTGLGLAFCKMAVNAHDGTIAIVSPRRGHDDGAEVVIRLPQTIV